MSDSEVHDMDGDVKQLMQRRSRLRAVITRYMNMTDTYLRTNDIARLEFVLKTLQDKSVKLVELNEMIQELIDEMSLDKEIQTSLEYDVKIQDVIKSIDSFLKRDDKPMSTSSSVKLPKLQLPKFSGDKLEFRAFWDMFETTILHNNSLSKVQKFAYLMSCLTGEAKASVAGLSINGDNFKMAIDILHDRFGRTDTIVREHLSKLQSIKPPSTSPSSLRQFLYDMSMHIRCLENFNISSDKYETMLMPIILQKLPEEIRLRVLSDKRPLTDVYTVDGFVKLLEHEVSVREECKENSNNPGKAQSNAVFPSKTSPLENGTAVALPTIGASSREEKRGVAKMAKFCVYCTSKDHYSSDCLDLKDVTARTDFLKQQKRCFICLRKYHNAKNCRNKRHCSKCSRLHHLSLCPNSNACESTSESAKKQNSSDRTVSLIVRSSPAIILPAAKVILCSQDGSEMRARILLDQCSTKTFIRNDVCHALGITPDYQENLNICTFGSDTRISQPSGKVKFGIKKVGDSEEILLTGNMIETICSSQPSYKLHGLSPFSDLDMADEFDPRDSEMPISVLIGADHYYDIVTDSTVRSKAGPVALSSRIGWLASGVLTIPDGGRNDTDVLHVVCSHSSENALQDELKEFWSMEHLGITPSEYEDSTDFLPNVAYDTELNSYSVKLPWKIEKESIKLDTNFGICLRRLSHVLKQLRDSPETLAEYDRVLKEQLSLDIIERVPETPTGSIVHYLPHHPVIRPHAESTKLRVVLDASSTKSSLSLNDCLDKGPCMLPQIPLLLTKFRFHRIAILADIEKAFLQISIDESDRDALRIIWPENPECPNSKLNIYRYKTLVFGLTCSPAILESIMRKHITKYIEEEPALTELLLNDFYVDNLVSGAKNVEESIDVFQKSRQIFRKGHFNLRQWKSNDEEFLNYVNSTLAGDSKLLCHEYTFADENLNPTVSADTNVYDKVLGISWDKSKDEFVIDLSFLKQVESGHLLKRDLLHIIGRIYDPLGILCPIIIFPKILFQKVCQSKVHWSSPIDADIEKDFTLWLNEASEVTLRIQRCLFEFESEIDKVSIHGFSDASTICYAAAVYLRVAYVSGKVKCFLLMAKSRAAPTSKPQTIPRLELLGALILARMLSFLSPALQNREIVCWSDSKNVLYWVRQEHKLWKTFIENRVREIRKLVGTSCWRYIPGHDNPCDLATRPVKPLLFLSHEEWFNGPTWLRQTQDNWPAESEDISDSTNVISDEVHVDTCVHIDADKNSLLNIIDINKYSSYDFLLRVCAYVYRVSPHYRSRFSSNSTIELKADELAHAELQLLRALQAVDFGQELIHLEQGTASTNLTRNLRLFLDHDGLIRCRGRLSACYPANSNCPILFPKNDHFCKIFVAYMHEKVLHGGESATLAKIREKHWLIRGRQVVRKFLKKCVLCRRINGLPYKHTPIPDLPSCRVEKFRAFQTVGLDYCGPLRYRQGEDGTMAKCYICVYTCTSTRAVHLELVPNLSTVTFLQSLRRFTARRGIPSIISDNFTSFKKAFVELDAVSTDSVVQRHVGEKRIQWHFITEYSPWQGGFYERLVREVKDCLKKILKFAIVEYEELQTVITEIEAILNSRPLCYVSDEIDCILTPSHFLILDRLTNTPIPTEQEPNLLKKLKGSRRLLESFWRIWYERYLASLRERIQKNPRTCDITPKEGDVVLLKENKPRLQWKTGRITECQHGRDGAVRSAIVKVADSKGSFKLVRRPTKLLIPLEMSENLNL